MFLSQAEAQQESEGLVGFEQVFQSKQWCMFTGNERFQLNLMKLTTIIRNAESGSNHCISHQSTQNHMAVGLKA